MDCQRVWYPTIFPDKCDGCIKFNEARCVKFCPHNVFGIRDGKVIVVNPQNCIYGCVACEYVCPRRAIAFPMRAATRQVAQRDKGLLKRVKCRRGGKIFR
ncbi:MAG: 4Fe-4S dicluster domain-containing protein, partial [Candidatus Bathyarchaeia archaeon]